MESKDEVDVSRVNMRTLSHLLTFVYAGESNSISALSVIKNGSFEPEPVVSQSYIS